MEPEFGDLELMQVEIDVDELLAIRTENERLEKQVTALQAAGTRRVEENRDDILRGNLKFAVKMLEKEIEKHMDVCREEPWLLNKAVVLLFRHIHYAPVKK